MPALRAMVEALIESEQVCINVRNEAHEAEAREVLRGYRRNEFRFTWSLLMNRGAAITGRYFSRAMRIRVGSPPSRAHRATRGAPAPLAVVDWDYNAGETNIRHSIWMKLRNTCREDPRSASVLSRMILEGGAIDVNGAGALLTSESCLLNKIEIQIFRAKRSNNACGITWAFAIFSGSATESQATTRTATSMIWRGLSPNCRL